ncbi:MAG: C_GCAxxG_C_C family protein [Desulfobacterales bacterium]|nr:C-GCAxxG-C-C family protein [Deltaproteobacteria bacterium]NNK97254.1 C_GCAxxG_C_C family protein [Desulfobacterales bacterium]
MNRVSQAVNNFYNDYACSQAIFTEYSELFDVNRETALRLASGFAGGMYIGGVCGALSGAYLVLGLKFGAQNCETPQGRKNVREAVKEFAQEFKKITGAVSCKHLLGCDISTVEGLQTAKEQNLFRTTCPHFVRTAAELLEIYLEKSFTSG